VVLCGRLFFLQVIQHDQYAGFARDNQLQRERIPAPRGFIKDRAGHILVDNVLHFEVKMPWHTREDVSGTVAQLAAWLPLDTTRIMQHFDAWKKKNGYAAFPVIPDAGKFTVSFVRANSDRFPTLRVVSKARRRYRKGTLAAHLLGYVGEVGDAEINQRGERRYYPGDMAGKTGLELQYENKLRGTDGQRVLEVNASGLVLGELTDLSTPPRAGANLYLTIDAALQARLEELLTGDKPATGVVIDVHDGAVLAAASYPTFDPNLFATGIPQAALDALLNDDAKPLFNRISQARYPPASTLKIVSTAAILSNDLVDPGEILVYCSGIRRFGNRIYRCWKASGHGAMNLMTAFIQSCDVYYYKVGEIMDVDMLAATARDFGLGAPTGIDLPGETSGLVPDRKYYDRRLGSGKWTQGQMLNNIIGQGEYLVSVLQLVRVCASVANGGYLVTPHLVNHVEGEAPVAWSRRRVPELAPKTVSFLRRAMRGVVDDADGTAHWTRLDWLATAGKTGTAQNPHGGHHALYVAYAPADDPEIAMAVIVENAGHGGEIAAPIARDFFASYFGATVSTRIGAEGGEGKGQ